MAIPTPTVESMNTKVDLVEPGTSFLGIGAYGKIMIGDKAFEFYDDRKVSNYIQIPWDKVDVVMASVMFGKKIPRFALHTTQGISYSFAARDSKKVLRAIREYIPADHIVKSLSVAEVVSRGVKQFVHKIKK